MAHHAQAQMQNLPTPAICCLKTTQAKIREYLKLGETGVLRICINEALSRYGSSSGATASSDDEDESMTSILETSHAKALQLTNFVGSLSLPDTNIKPSQAYKHANTILGFRV